MKKKSLNAKKKIHKHLLNNLKDQRIKKIFNNFNYIIKSKFKLLDTKKIGIAVSGGPDSLALAYLIKCYILINNTFECKCFVVDHKLRRNSSKEAITVRKLLKKFDLNCEILFWKGKKPNSNIQSKARDFRYQLLMKACKKNKIKNLFLGHHKDDLYENFFIRLIRGSGLKGLVSLAKGDVKLSKDFVILRPLLNIEKKDLKYISKKVFNYYIEDPSNKNLDFQRIRLRKLIKEFHKEGLNLNKLNLTIKNLNSANLSIESIVNNNIESNSKFINNKCILNENFFCEGNEIVFRSFSEVLRRVSGRHYSARGNKISRAIKVNILNAKMKDFTLGGCIIKKINKTLIISREKRD